MSLPYDGIAKSTVRIICLLLLESQFVVVAGHRQTNEGEITIYARTVSAALEDAVIALFTLASQDKHGPLYGIRWKTTAQSTDLRANAATAVYFVVALTNAFNIEQRPSDDHITTVCAERCLQLIERASGDRRSTPAQIHHSSTKRSRLG